MHTIRLNVYSKFSAYRSENPHAICYLLNGRYLFEYVYLYFCFPCAAFYISLHQSIRIKFLYNSIRQHKTSLPIEFKAPISYGGHSVKIIEYITNPPINPLTRSTDDAHQTKATHARDLPCGICPDATHPQTRACHGPPRGVSESKKNTQKGRLAEQLTRFVAHLSHIYVTCLSRVVSRGKSTHTKGGYDLVCSTFILQNASVFGPCLSYRISHAAHTHTQKLREGYGRARSPLIYFL